MIKLILCALLIHGCIPWEVYDTMDDCIDEGRLKIEDIPVSAFCFDTVAEKVIEVKMRKTGTK